jgi:hypothetical protein
MTTCKFSVKVSLSEKTTESSQEDEIINHSTDHESLLPPFDKIEEEALKNKGGFRNLDKTSCDYCFDSKEDAKRFIKAIRTKFKTKIKVEFKEEKQTKSYRKTFKALSNSLPERISELTPKTINGKKIGIHIIENEVLLLPENKDHSELLRLTYANIRCKVRSKTISHPLVLRSATKIAQEIIKSTEGLSFEEAKNSGWKDSDISYDMIINGVFKKDVLNEKYNDKVCPEIEFATTHIKIVIADYLNEQFVGWFFYNDNLDEPLNYTSYSS